MLLEGDGMPVHPSTGQLALLPAPDSRESVWEVWERVVVPRIPAV